MAKKRKRYLMLPAIYIMISKNEPVLLTEKQCGATLFIWAIG